MKRLFDRIPSFSRSGKHSLAYLNSAQFLGAVNDNVFKFVVAFLLIDTLGYSSASTILSATGAIYVIPFLFFSSSAGILADRFSKQKLLVIMKVAEMGIMTIAIFAFAAKSIWGCYTLLFILSTHSAIFGPSKYGIIPELVPEGSVSRANGIITGFTYLAVIVGTFFASFLTEITDRRFALIAIFCLLVALGGFFSALAIKPTLSQGSKEKMNFLFIREIYRTLKYTRTIRHLIVAIFGSSFFLLIGAFTQLNIIPFALQSLNLSEVAGGYLFLATALGIATGSFFAGKASRKRVELGLSCLAGFGLSLLFILLNIFAANLFAVIICLITLGVLGGAFIVPFDTFTQIHSHNVKRGQTIAAANFLSFSGVLLASFALYFLSSICGLSSAANFTVMGILTGAAAIAFSCCLSDLFFPYLSRVVLHRIARVESPHPIALEKMKGAILVLEEGTWWDALLLAGMTPNIHFLIPQESKRWHWFHRFFDAIHDLPGDTNGDALLQIARTYTDRELIPCILLHKALPRDPRSVFDFFKRYATKVLIAKRVKKTFVFERYP